MISTSGACQNTPSWFLFLKKLRLFHNRVSSQSKQLFFKIILLLNQPQPAQVNVKCFIQLKKPMHFISLYMCMNMACNKYR